MSVPVVVNDIAPRIQITAGGGQTVFTYPFLIFAATDLNVYQTPAGQLGNDVTQILTYNVNYTVTNNVQPAVGGTITLNVAANAGDIITITRNMPEARLNNYIAGGLFQAVDVNTDFDNTVLMAQQNKMSQHNCGPYYNYSSIITPIVDNILPILPANCGWVMNANRTAIEAVQLTGGGGGGGVVLPTTPGQIAIFFNATGTIQNSGFYTPALPGNAGDSLINTGGGQLGNATIPGRNRLTNGDMQIWQRDAGGTASIAVAGGANGYTADRWQMVSGAATNCTVSQQPGPTSSTFYARVQRDNANAGVAASTFSQSLIRSACIGMASNIVTFSFKALHGANYSPAGAILTVNLIYGTGTTDVSAITTGFTGQTVVLTHNFVLTGVEQSFSMTTAALPATVTQFCVSFSFTPVGVALADDWFEVRDCQLEVSALVTPFERFDFFQSIMKCLPYYRKSFEYNIAPAQNTGLMSSVYIFPATAAGANGNVLSKIVFEPPMFANPTVTFFNPGAANAVARDITQGSDFGTTTVQQSGADGLSIVGNGNVNTLAGDVCGIHYTLESELV